MNFAAPDKIAEHRLNHILWFATHVNEPYPASAH
jgi:hypothetical protein